MNAHYPDLAEKQVIITGGANGIGESMVRLFSEQGAVIHFCDIDAEKGAALESELENCRFTEVDLEQPDQIASWIGAI